MSGTFIAETDLTKSLLRLSMAGFFDRESVDRLDVARRDAIDQLGAGPNQHLTLVDISACKLQSQEIVGAFEDVLSEPRYTSRKLAFVTGSSLARMQVRRMVKGAPTAWFEDVASAEAWLLDEASEQSAAA